MGLPYIRSLQPCRLQTRGHSAWETWLKLLGHQDSPLGRGYKEKTASDEDSVNPGAAFLRVPWRMNRQSPGSPHLPTWEPGPNSHRSPQCVMLISLGVRRPPASHHRALPGSPGEHGAATEREPWASVRLPVAAQLEEDGTGQAPRSSEAEALRQQPGSAVTAPATRRARWSWGERAECVRLARRHCRHCFLVPQGTAVSTPHNRCHPREGRLCLSLAVGFLEHDPLLCRANLRKQYPRPA